MNNLCSHVILKGGRKIECLLVHGVILIIL